MVLYNSQRVTLMPYLLLMRYKELAPLIFLGLFSGAIFGQELAPEFEGKDIYGDSTLRLSDYRGKVVFIDFWASWCPPCLLSLPAYDAMYRELGNTQFEIIAINVDEDTEDGLYFLEDYPVTYPVLADPVGDIGIPYRIRTLPASFLLDREGRIVRSFRNFKSGDEVALKQEIESLLQQD